DTAAIERYTRESDAEFRRFAAPGVATPMTNRDIVYVALFAALVAVLGLIPPIPLPVIPVPITAQSLGVMLAGSLLGMRRGGLALLVFLGLVAVGLPLLAGGRGGLGVFLGPSGGFVLAFPLAAAVIGGLTQRLWRRLNAPLAFAINAVGGIGVLYAIGVPWLAIATDLSLRQAAQTSMAFIPGDLVKAAIAALAVVAVKRAYPAIAQP
ncbi:MAG: biotin transporter BioY, partial [Elainellaceae cyanobacterium]